MLNKKIQPKQPADEQLMSEQTTKKKKFSWKLLRRLLPVLAVLVIVLLISVLSTMADGDHFSALRRYLMYGSSSETQELYTYASHQGNLFEPLGEELLVVNPHNIQILHQDGTALYELQVDLTAPIISVGSELAAVCDAEGSEVYVFSSTGLRWSHKNADRLLCYCARLCGEDHLVVTEQKIGYKASVSVYNSEGTLIFRFDSHDRYISDAIVTEDGKYLIALALGEYHGTFSTFLVVYDIYTEQRIGDYPLLEGLTLDMSVAEDRIVLVCDDRLAVSTLSGELLLNFTYGEQYLHDYALGGEDFCALLMSRYQSSNICRLNTFSSDGKELASLDITEEVLDISAAGDRLAVLYSDALILYDRNLNEVARLNGTDHAGYVRMDHDGTALLIAETFARRFLP